MRRNHLAAACLVLGLLPVAASAGDWPQFHGPGATGATAGKDLPAEWGADKNIAWKAKLPGYGWSSPIVWGDKVFVTTASSDKQRKPITGFGGGGFGGGGRGFGGGGGGGGRGFGGGRGGSRPPDAIYKWEVYCLNAADGKVVWKQTAAEKKPAVGVSGFSTYAVETPATDGERIYAYFGPNGVYCYDLKGKKLWGKDVGVFHMSMGHGGSSSPALDDKRLYIQSDNEDKSFLLALDKKTGKQLWKVDRKERTGWATPLVWKNKKRTEIICQGSSRVVSYDPASGKVLWELGGMSGQCKASPTASEDLLYVGTGGGFGGGMRGGFGGPGGGGRGGRGGRGGFGGGNKPLYAVKAGASGDITLKSGDKSNDGVAWYQAQGGPSTASPLFYQGHLYVLGERGGLLTCFDAKTGKQIYKERLSGARGFTPSPWAYEGKIFCLADDGVTFVVQAGSTFKLLGKNDLDQTCWASTAVGNGSVFLRTIDYVFCIKGKK